MPSCCPLLQTRESNLSSRPEAPWALWCGVAGALAATVLSVRSILATPGAEAAMSFVVVPVIAIVVAVPAGVWGLALGHLVARARGKVGSAPGLLAAAVAAALALPIAALHAMSALR